MLLDEVWHKKPHDVVFVLSCHVPMQLFFGLVCKTENSNYHFRHVMSCHVCLPDRPSVRSSARMETDFHWMDFHKNLV